MLKKLNSKKISVLFVLGLLFNVVVYAAEEPQVLPSWQDSQVKSAIVSFVTMVTNVNLPQYVKPVDRIAVFDNDGTVQLEKPFSFIDVFALVTLQKNALKNVELQKDPLVQKVVNSSLSEIADLTRTLSRDKKNKKESDFEHLFNLGNAGQLQEDIDKNAYEFTHSFKHPRFNLTPAKLVYKPMVELIKYLRDNGFTIYFVSGSTTDYLRSFSEEIGIEKNNVIGWEYKGVIEYDKQSKMHIFKTTEVVEPTSLHAGKPVNIARYIGKRPIFAIGNSSGDIEMLTYTIENNLPSISLIISHDDDKREYAYDFGKKTWEIAKKQGWHVVSMKNDWKEIF